MLRSHKLRIALSVAALTAAIPVGARAADQTAGQAAGIAADTVWVVVAACFVLFMQAGFAMLEVGFARMKNVGTVVAKIVVNMSIASIMYWICGFALAFGAANGFLSNILGWTGFMPTFHPGSAINLPAIASMRPVTAEPIGAPM